MINVSPTLRQLALRWLMNEPGVWQKLRHATDADRLAIAMPRVLAVVAGEVKWSEASPGDREIWKGRARNVDAARANVDRYLNQYDSLLILPEGGRPDLRQAHRYHWSPLVAPSSQRIFGNSNVGNYHVCSLQVAGMLGFDSDVHIAQVYAVASRQLVAEDIVHATMNIGCRQVRGGPLREWIAGMPGGADCRVPPRQNFDMRIDVSRVAEPLELTFHVEGTEAWRVQ